MNCLAASDLYQIQISDKREDPAWDAFLRQTPGGHYTQSSLWAQVKAPLGWRALRIVLSQGERIVAGVQFLIRSLPIGGTISYAPGGPLVTLDDPVLIQLMIAQLHKVAKDSSIQYLLVQPRCMSEAFNQELLSQSFRPSSRNALAVSTALLDLTQDLDSLLMAMRKTTRHNIRLSERKGVTIREGNECDLPTFYRLIMITCQRNNLPIFPLEYFHTLWRILHPYGYLRIFLAEYMGEAVATSLVIPFGDTVTDSIGGWSGLHAKAHPNELLEWAAIGWAKAHGFRYFDFDGVTSAVARGEVVPDANREGATFYKLGFGGKAVLFPIAYEYLPNPLFRWAYTTIDQKIAHGLGMTKLETFIRGLSGSGTKKCFEDA